jgi:hypothetical protein
MIDRRPIGGPRHPGQIQGPLRRVRARRQDHPTRISGDGHESVNPSPFYVATPSLAFLVAARPARSAGFPVSQVIEAIKAEINEAAALASVRA